MGATVINTIDTNPNKGLDDKTFEAEKKRLKEMGITEESLNDVSELIKRDPRYGNNFDFIASALRMFPDNDDDIQVAMKISFIDMTNSTSLSRLLGDKQYGETDGEPARTTKRPNLKDLVDGIIGMRNFDERVRRGDKTLVSELAEKFKEYGEEGDGVNLFSFFSKYCLYHNEFCKYLPDSKRHGDDFYIYDKVVKENLGDEKNLSTYEYEQLEKSLHWKRLTQRQTVASKVAREIENLRLTYNYEGYCELLDKVLEVKGIDNRLENKRRKLDNYIWYLYRTPTDTDK